MISFEAFVWTLKFMLYIQIQKPAESHVMTCDCAICAIIHQNWLGGKEAKALKQKKHSKEAILGVPMIIHDGWEKEQVLKSAT